MKIYNCEQKTEEWYNCRKLKMTASHANAIKANGKGLETYILELIAESMSSAPKVQYTDKSIERGNELESVARDMFELQTGKTVKQVGFVELDEYVGCSPDGLLDDDGLVEIKCHDDKNHLILILEDKAGIDIKYYDQIQFQLYVTGRQYCIYVGYNPNFEKSLTSSITGVTNSDLIDPHI